MRNYTVTHQPKTAGGYRWNIDRQRTDNGVLVGSIRTTVGIHGQEVDEYDKQVGWLLQEDGSLKGEDPRYDIALREPSDILNNSVVTSPTRVPNEDFIPSLTQPAILLYTMASSIAATEADPSDDATAVLLVNGSPFTGLQTAIQATVLDIFGALGFEIDDSSGQFPLIGYVEAGQTVNIQTSGNMSIVLAKEILL